MVSGYVSLRDCLDLLDISCWPYVRAAYNLMLKEHAQDGTPRPRQQPSFYRENSNNGPRKLLGLRVRDPGLEQGFNYLDCNVVDRAVLLAELYTQRRVASVRAAFLEGQQLYANSYFFDRNHVEIAVRDPGMISDLFIEPEDELRKRFGPLSPR